MKKLFTYAISFFIAVVSCSATTHMVDQTNFTFVPNAFVVEVGDIVEWHWSSGTHTTTSISVPTGAATWDSPLTSANPTFQYTVTVAGNYAFKCTPHFSMNMVGGFVANAAQAITEVQVETDLNVSTVPQNSTLIVKMGTSVPGTATVKIIDISGRIVDTIFKEEIGAGEKQISYNISELNRGIYFVHFSLNGKESTRKFIAN